MRISILFIFLTHFIHAQISKESIYLLDISSKNNDSLKNDLFSSNHALIVAGTPYTIGTKLQEAIEHKFLLISSIVEPETFNKAEKDSLINYVKSGGILFCTQLKDPYLFELFGVSNYKFSTLNKTFTWNLETIGKAGEFINHENEKTIRFADSTFSTIFGTRSYTPTTGVPLAYFNEKLPAFIKNKLGLGTSYLLGINFEDLILRNQVMKHYKASRMYSNGFETASDLFYYYLRGIFQEHQVFATHKHTSIDDSESILVITHDVDATSAIKDIMTDFSSYEYENNIRASYFITTHYMHDSVAKNFWTGYTNEIKSVLTKKHEVASHSVSHMPDFDNSGIAPLGDCGHNEMENYKPFFDGIQSKEVTVCGETEVSKKLLDNHAGANVKSFRAGYLAYNKGIIEALENTGYEYNTSSSANNVLTAYPFQAHINLSMNSRISPIYEIPNTISDVFMDERISEENYNKKVAIWAEVQRAYAEDNAPSILLIHPNRPWKITAQQNFIKQLPKNTAILPFEAYGAFWKNREKCNFKQSTSSDSVVTLTFSTDSINSGLSFIIKNGKFAKKIHLINKQGDTLQTNITSWRTNDVIIHNTHFEENYTEFEYLENENIRAFQINPNPISSSTNIQFELINDSEISLLLLDNMGRKIDNTVQGYFELGEYSIPLNSNNLNSGIYHYQFWVNDSLLYKGKLLKP